MDHLRLDCGLQWRSGDFAALSDFLDSLAALMVVTGHVLWLRINKCISSTLQHTLRIQLILVIEEHEGACVSNEEYQLD